MVWPNTDSAWTFDGVVYNWDDTVGFLLNHYFGYDLPVSTHWDQIQRSVKPEHWEWLWDEGVKKGMFRYGHLYKGSAEALRELAEMVDIVVITHRPANAVQDTLEWLAYNRVPATEVHILTKEQPKWEIACDLYLDDAPHNIKGFLEHRPLALSMLWARPWNVDYQRVAPVVVRDWSEVIKLTRAFVAANGQKS